MSRRRKKKLEEVSQGVELNVMPFIDIFSLLCTFLLFSAVFISMGIHTVQVPFFTNASSDKKDDSKPERELTLKVDISKDAIELVTKWTLPPKDYRKEKFANSPEGQNTFHQRLVKYKQDSVKSDKINVTVDDDVIFDELSKILDAITNKLEDDPEILGESGPVKQLFPKVVLQSVIL